MRLTIVIVALGLAGCAGVGGLQTSLKPKVVFVSDLTFASEVVAIDRGYTARLERKIGAYPAYQRRQRTEERVNAEIVATIIATLQEGGIAAQAGGEDTLTLDENALVLSGNLRPNQTVTEKNKNNFGFGAGRGHIVASMTGVLFSAGGKREVLAFNAEVVAGKRDPAVPPKIAAARNATINSLVAASGGPTERLSPDVEGLARGLGRKIGERVLAFAKEQGWNAVPAEPASPGGPGVLSHSNPSEKSETQVESAPPVSDSDQ
ncbi:MAG TPA: hypothetical protein VLU23_05035 [Pseudolabrys sp.]|nr:hypothetical protein [Pseudolabrys sp.]